MNQRKARILAALFLYLVANGARGDISKNLADITATTNGLLGKASAPPVKAVEKVSVEERSEIEIAAEVEALKAVSALTSRTRDPFGLKMRGNFKLPDVELLPKATKKKVQATEISFEDAVENIPLTGLNRAEKMALIGHRTVCEGDLLAWQWKGKAFQGWVSHIGPTGIVVEERGSDKSCLRRLNSEADLPEWRVSEPDYASLPGAEPVPPDHSVNQPVIPPPLPLSVPVTPSDSVDSPLQPPVITP